MTAPGHFYRLYGLYFHSDIAIPEMTSSVAGSDQLNQAEDVRQSGADAHVRIARGAVPADGAAIGPQIGPFSHAAPGALWLHIPGVARFLVLNGDSILYDPDSAADEDSLRLFLLGSCVGTLLLQRGNLVLHGNAFAMDAGCAVCVGPSGAGKSTLAVGMMRCGHAVIADDVCLVDTQGHAVPGMPRVKLWADAAERFAIETTGLQRIREDFEKFDLPLGQSYCSDPLPIRAIYILSPWNRETFAVKELTGIAKFAALREHTYRFRFLKGMGLGAGHIAQCGALAARVSVVTLHRPRQGFDIDGLVDCLSTDFSRRSARS